MIIPEKYQDFVDKFLTNLAIQILYYIKIYNHAIKPINY